MNIQVSSGTGIGPTELAAFDQALIQAGAANYNLIYLSSVLPPNSKVKIERKPKKSHGNWGDKLYVVMSQIRTSQRNQEVWAGIGWFQDPETKQGMLVEHEGHNEAEVKADIAHTLMALARNRGMKFGPHHMHVVGTKCVDLPACAVVVAVFEAVGWRGMRMANARLPAIKLTRKSHV